MRLQQNEAMLTIVWKSVTYSEPVQMYPRQTKSQTAGYDVGFVLKQRRDDKTAVREKQPSTHRVRDNRLRTGWEKGVGDGWLMQHDCMVLFDYGRYPDNIITPRHHSLPTLHRLSSREPTQVTNFSVLPTMGGFYRGKVGGRYWGEHRKCTAFAPCHQNLKRVNFMLSKTQPAIESKRERQARKCRIPVFPLRRRVAETRFDCCPRPRTPFLLVSEAALALAGREGETQENSVIFNFCLPEKLTKHPHSPVQKELTAKVNFAVEILK